MAEQQPPQQQFQQGRPGPGGPRPGGGPGGYGGGQGGYGPGGGHRPPPRGGPGGGYGPPRRGPGPGGGGFGPPRRGPGGGGFGPPRRGPGGPMGGRPPQRKLLVAREELAEIEKLYKPMLPLPNPDAHVKIGEKLDMNPNKVFFGINLIRQKMKLPKLEFPKRPLAVTQDQLMAVKALYEPFLPMPPIGVHKIISKQLKMEEWRVHVAIGLIRKQMAMPRWNEEREDIPAEMKKQIEASQAEEEKAPEKAKASEKAADKDKDKEEKKAAPKKRTTKKAAAVEEDDDEAEEKEA